MDSPTFTAAAAGRPSLAVRSSAAAGVAVLLVLGLVGGLQRAGALPWAAATEPAALNHGALMISAFLGSVIAIERAVALRTPLARSVPLLSVAGGLALVAGGPALAPALLSLAAALSVWLHVRLWRRHREAPHGVLAMGSVSWLLGNLAWWWQGEPAEGAQIAWFGFLVLTIAAERLELTRLTRRTPAALQCFAAVLSLLGLAVVGACLGWAGATALFGASLAALACWLALHDIARRTVGLPGLPGYIARALWCAYAWLALAGLAWLTGWRDTALHALGIGFVLSMVMAHAPVILPAVAGVRVAFGPPFYVPLALLQLSLAWRLALDLRSGAWLHIGALLLFALAMARGVHKAGRERNRSDADAAAHR